MNICGIPYPCGRGSSKKEHPNDEFCLLIGSDLVPDFYNTWKDAEKISKEVQIFEISRKGYVKNPVIFPKIEFESYDVSSSMLRKQLAKKENNVKEWICHKVLEYIKHNELY